MGETPIDAITNSLIQSIRTNNQAPELYHSGDQTESQDGARNRNRTGTPSLARDFKSLVSTNFTIRAKRTAGTESGGASRSRTDLHGFAIRCITALLSRRRGELLKRKGENIRAVPSVFPRILERERRFELPTSTLARLRSTN